MTPAEAIIDALQLVAHRHETYASACGVFPNSERLRAEAAADRRVAAALRDVAQEFALALGIER